MSDAVRELEGRVALVTGASRNIGRAIALALAEGGAAVIVAGRRDRAAVDEVVGAIEAKGGRAIGVLGDLVVPADVEAIVAAGLSAFGRLDILVNNAAVRGEAPLDQLTVQGWREVMALSLDAPFITVKAALDALSQVGPGRYRQYRRADRLYRRQAPGACGRRQGRPRRPHQGARP